MTSARQFSVGLLAALGLAAGACTQTTSAVPSSTAGPTTATKPVEGVLTGVVQACEGAFQPGHPHLTVVISVLSGPLLIASQTLRSGGRYHFSVVPGSYELQGWWGSKAVEVGKGAVVTRNFANYCR